MTNKKRKHAIRFILGMIVVVLVSALIAQNAHIAFGGDVEPKALLQQAEEAEAHTVMLIEKIQNMIEISHQEIETRVGMYDEYLSRDARLTHEHITYGSRVALTPEKFITQTTHPSEARVSTYNLDLRTPSSVTAYELDEMVLKGTALKGLGKDFVNAELEYGVNAMFLVSLAIHESGWGRSAIARDKNNLFGFRAYDKSPYLSATTFRTKGDSVRAAAKLLSGSYLIKSGRYYGGGFTAAHINKKYASDKGWASKITATMASLDAKIMAKQNKNYHDEIYLIEEGGEIGGNTYSEVFRANN